ncbi:MAG: NTP transferase domain-containing protein [Chloroflexi bacterium]|nr:NTP transferase domain-containing protein [Chloroflexota bacterium]
MQIVVPMAGRGARFAEQGVNTPKPLIPVLDRPMVAWALQSLDGLAYSRLIFVALREHDTDHSLNKQLRDLVGDDIEIILLDDVTDGQLRTVMAARDLISTDEDVLIANCDTYMISQLGQHIRAKHPECRGIISVGNMPGDRWSFARTDTTGRVVEVAEKVRISDHASTGYYYFTSGRELVEVADEMFSRGEKTRGEYYVIPVYQKYIERGWRVDISQIDSLWDMGTPEALAAFEQQHKQG